MIRPSLLASALVFFANLPAAAAALSLDVYNPGAKSMFPVASEIVSGESDAVLIDAQFQRNDAEALASRIKATGKRLTTVYVSHGDPDYYFGLDVIRAAFPAAKIVASAQTVAAIKASMDGKLAYWGPILKDKAPKALVLPEVLQGDKLMLEGQALEIKGLNGPSPERSYVWIPSLRTVVGGAIVYSGDHVWVADTQTAQSRRDWRATLASIEALKPTAVVPGHFLGAAPKGLGAVKFTAAYLDRFEKQAGQARDSGALIAAMKQAYPELGEVSSLELSAKVIKGEMKWPQ
ncbi:MBL fold metallo-hydrolase [Chitinimonas arctica]|uniref:MBL fold metallo-hydrolase n=1 Tax=Chitinimonas arctica TaxID=2594795 RepID=A0A516SBG0_9NEIS|nr:MBL fold metallo-hydrolase [Chitinimonas arctica]QDQ25485.1 MBL fold metallo-hydrolase [Chitinimonas arctica]